MKTNFTIEVKPDEDLDATFELPNGNRVVIQYREETGALDVCFREPIYAEVQQDKDGRHGEVTIPGLYQVMTVVAERREPSE